MNTTITNETVRAPSSAWERTTALSLLLWGLLHVAGGVVLMFGAASDPLEGLRSLGSGAAPDAFPLDPGPVTAALIGFHGLNIAFSGVAVTALAVWAWRSYPKGVPTALIIATAADVGLAVYLLGSGHMRFTDGLWGPVLLAAAAGAAALARQGR